MGNINFHLKSEWDSFLKKWIGIEGEQTINEFDSNGIQTLESRFIWDKTLKDWVGNGTKVEKNYDDKGRLILYANYYWDKTLKSWVGYSKQVLRYDDKGKETLLAIFNWDKTLKDWIGDYKYEISYDKFGVIISYATFNWDRVIKDWIGNYKSIIFIDYSYDTLSIILPEYLSKAKYISRINFNWDSINNDWQIRDTTKYYYSDFNPNSVENELAVNPDFHIFPNPSSENISLDLGSLAVADLVVYDILGNEIMSISNYTNKRVIDISTLSIGTYTIQLQTSRGSISQRLMVNR